MASTCRYFHLTEHACCCKVIVLMSLALLKQAVKNKTRVFVVTVHVHYVHVDEHLPIRQCAVTVATRRAIVILDHAQARTHTPRTHARPRARTHAHARARSHLYLFRQAYTKA